MSWRLILSGTSSVWWTLFACLAAGAVIRTSVRLLRRERQLVSPRVYRTLLVIRCLLLGLLLLLMLRPVLTNRPRTTDNGRLVFLTDASMSMQTADRHASAVERIRWAQSLGMLGDAASAAIEEELSAISQSTQADSTRTSSPQIDALVDAAASAVADMSRSEIAQQLLFSPNSALISRAEQTWITDLRLFAERQKAVTTAEMQTSTGLDRPDLNPARTDLLDSLRQIAAEPDADRIRAVILLSDGQQTESGDPDTEAARLSVLGIPVYAIPIGSARPPTDLSVLAINAPESVFLNDTAAVTAVIGTAGFQGQKISVELLQDGAVIEEQKIVPTTTTTELSFTIPADTAGNHEYSVRVTGQQQEIRTDNNLRSFTMQVVDSSARVMIVEGDARWEFRYLRNLFERDEQVQSTSILLHQPWLKILNEPGFATNLPPAELFREELARTDILFLGDIAQDEVEDSALSMIEDAVSNDGLTVILTPGQDSLPWQWTNNDLQALLPVHSPRRLLAEQFLRSQTEQNPTEFQMLVSPALSDLPMLQDFSGTLQFGQREPLDGPQWIATGTPKSGSVTWMSASIRGQLNEQYPLIVHQDYGFGQIIWMGMDSTWRWRKRAGDSMHYQFWGKLVRWAARNRTAAGNADVRLSLSRSVVASGDSVTATVRWNRRLLSRLSRTSVELLLVPQQPDGAEQPEHGTRSVRLQPDSEHPEKFTAEITAGTEGTWNVVLQTEAAPVQVPQTQTELIIRDEPSAELARISCDRDFLKELSVSSGGQLVEMWQAADLLNSLQPDTIEAAQLTEWTLWDHWGMLVVFMVLLTAEWVIRRTSGLP